MIIINVTFSTTTAVREQFIEQLKTIQSASSKEQGCELYRFSVDLDDALCFHLIEMWQDEAALLGHLQSEHFKTFLSQIPQLASMKSSTSFQGDMAPYSVPR